jgi:hypothetical protein
MSIFNLLLNGSRMKKCKFVVCAPPYVNHSAGIIIMHELYDALIQNGHQAYMAFMHMSEGQWDFHYPVSEQGFAPHLKNIFLDRADYAREVEDALDNGICIYPEIIRGNPLMANRVARYFLYHDGGISGVKSDYTANDYLIAYSAIYIEEPHFVLFKPAIDPSMHDQGAPDLRSRGLDLTFFGKGPKHAECFHVEGSVELSKAWPKTKKELAILLRNTRYLYTWDCHSAVNIDAIFCGVRPVLMQSDQLESDQADVDPDYLRLFLPWSSSREFDKLGEDADYQRVRSNFLGRMSDQSRSWVGNVRILVSDMTDFFKI